MTDPNPMPPAPDPHRSPLGAAAHRFREAILGVSCWIDNWIGKRLNR